MKFPFLRLLHELTESSDVSNSYVDEAMPGSIESELEGAVPTPLRFNQAELNDLLKDLNLSKDTSAASLPG